MAACYNNDVTVPHA